MNKLDPGLKHLVASERLQPQSAPSADSTADARRQTLLIEFAGDTAALEAIGFITRARAGTILSGDIPVDALGRLEELPGLTRAEIARPLTMEIEDALSASSFPTYEPRTFSSTLVGIIDSGIDYRHRTFRHEDGTTRILAIWDQGLTAEGTEAPPPGFDYGVEYTREAIDAALRPTAPGDVLRHVDKEFHGTRVAGIAVGSGHPVGTNPTLRYRGAAPRADLVVVANTRTEHPGERSLGDCSDLFEAIAYIIRIADQLERPVVINCSQGANIGAHDGSSLIERAIDYWCARPGRVVVKSAGNEADVNRHAEGETLADVPQDVGFEVGRGAPFVIIDVWYTGALGVAVIPPGETASEAVPVRPPLETAVPLAGGAVASFYATADDAGRGLHRTYIHIEKGAVDQVPSGRWTLRIEGAGRWDAWLHERALATFHRPWTSPRSTVTVPGTATSVITVGSFVSNGTFTGGDNGELSGFSSHGPTRDGRPAPTLCAPGEELTAAQPGGLPHGPQSGTSMAAPVVTGAVARLLDLNGRMTATDVKQHLQAGARRDRFTGDEPDANRWGAGKLCGSRHQDNRPARGVRIRGSDQIRSRWSVDLATIACGIRDMSSGTPTRVTVRTATRAPRATARAHTGRRTRCRRSGSAEGRQRR